MVVLPLVASEPRTSTERALAPLRALVDLLTEGAAAPPGADASAPTLLCDLASALADLSTLSCTRAIVRVRVDRSAWELGLERAGRDVLVSLFQGGALPEVALHERRVDAEAFAARVMQALEAGAGAGPSSGERLVDFESQDDLGPIHLEASSLLAARERLASSLPFRPEPSPSETAAVSVDPTGEVSVVLGADVLLRTPGGAAPPSGVLRADLLGLLFRGKLRLAIGEHTRELPDVFVFLVTEQLVAMAIDALEAATHARAFHRRVPIGGAICGIRVNPKGAASLTLGVRRRGSEERAEPATFPAVDLGALAQGILAFGRALARSLVRRDRAQAHNLRLVDLREQLRDLSDRVREVTRDDSKVNASPEGYRAFAAASRAARPLGSDFGHARLRYTPKWLATIPSIDLRGTFLCGDALIVGSTRETCCLDRRTGELAWRRLMPRGVSVMTPAGLARLEPDGLLSVHEIGTGEVAWTAKLAPRVGATASGAVVSVPGLPRMLLISEGARRLAAVDLDSGEVRWRHATRRGASFRIRRAGKLAILGSGEPSLTALDVLTGEVVWRYCDPLRFASHVAVDHDAVFAVAGGGALVGRGGARLHALDPWTGAAKHAVPLPSGVTPVGAPLLAPETAVIVTHGRAGTGVCAFDRKTLELRFERVVCAAAASCMIVDDAVIINSEGGELVAIDAHDGSLRYRHVFSGAEGDKPRRLEPVLRSGALFVPQSEVHVVRPRDGALLGKVPTDLIPDLLRVDERCDVYVVEESGHLAAFAAAPRLTLVQ